MDFFFFTFSQITIKEYFFKIWMRFFENFRSYSNSTDSVPLRFWTLKLGRYILYLVIILIILGIQKFDWKIWTVDRYFFKQNLHSYTYMCMDGSGWVESTSVQVRASLKFNDHFLCEEYGYVKMTQKGSYVLLFIDLA